MPYRQYRHPRERSVTPGLPRWLPAIECCETAPTGRLVRPNRLAISRETYTTLPRKRGCAAEPHVTRPRAKRRLCHRVIERHVRCPTTPVALWWWCR